MNRPEKIPEDAFRPQCMETMARDVGYNQCHSDHDAIIEYYQSDTYKRQCAQELIDRGVVRVDEDVLDKYLQCENCFNAYYTRNKEYQIIKVDK